MFMRLREKLARFMYGRNGSDQLNIGLCVVYLVLMIVMMFVRNYTIPSYIVSALEFALVVVLLWRMLSKNVYKRRAENAKFLRFWGKIKAEAKLTRDRFRDIKTNRYRKCPDCRAILRLPNKKGSHDVRCPKCGKSFKIRIIF